MSTVSSQFDLQTRLFRNTLDGVTDAEAGNRPSAHSNHIKFIAGHLVFTRLMMKDFAGLPSDDRFNQFDKNMDPNAEYLPMATILAKWDEISGPLSAALQNLPAEMLGADAPFLVPTGKSIQDLLDFLMHHEAYHIGQLGILRKFAGKEAMKYN
ncbi:MAG: DinB family protein [Bacteroidia bacterium]